MFRKVENSVAGGKLRKLFQSVVLQKQCHEALDLSEIPILKIGGY